jgi:DNA-binding MarR family transcriptional regulator
MTKNPVAERIAELIPTLMGAFHELRPPQSDEEALTLRQYQALILIYAHGQMTLSELCSKLALAPSTGTELANRMVAKGYLLKSGDERDRRLITLRLSQEGYRVMLQRRRLLTEMLSRFLARFEEEDQREFLACFERIAALIHKYGLPPAAPSGD